MSRDLFVISENLIKPCPTAELRFHNDDSGGREDLEKEESHKILSPSKLLKAF